MTQLDLYRKYPWRICGARAKWREMKAPPRQPGEFPEPRLGPLATLPVFFRLSDRRVVLVGGSDAAAWKAELLAAAGAHVDVYSVEAGERLTALVAQYPSIRLRRRAVHDDDFSGATLAVVDAGDEAAAALFRAAAKKAGVPINVIDKPLFSDFQFGAIVERSPLVIAISTDGGAPVFGQALRARIEAMLPGAFRLWAQAAKDWRPRVQALGLDFHGRRRFWEAFTKLAFTRAASAPEDADLDSLVSGLRDPSPGAKAGSVALIGAGPGDPELLTLKAVRLLQSADVVLYDDLVLPGTLDFARREAHKINVGKRGYKPSCTQEDISALMIAHARDGKRVVRLKGGDPMIFGRAGEEIAALRAAAVEVEIVPGVTSASAAAASLQVSLTERVTARRLQFITAHTRHGKLPDDFDWRALADVNATTAVYMGLKTLAPLCARLIAEGLPSHTPAILVERASCDGERQIVGTIADLPQKADAAAPTGPCMVLIGAALASASAIVR